MNASKKPDARVEYLDWLRALAVFAVVFGHCSRTLAPGGAVGVSVFFVISGFLITEILLSASALNLPNIARFILRRGGRIYPMYVLHILATCIFLYFFQPADYPRVRAAVPDMLTFWSIPTDWFGFAIGVLWTLQVEFWFYATFPFLLWFAIGMKSVLPCLFAALFVTVAAKVLGFGLPVGGDALTYYDHLLIGAIACAAIKSDAGPRFLRHRAAFSIGLAIILVTVLIPFAKRDLAWHVQSLAAAVGTAVVIVSATANPPAAKIPFLAYLGRISYSIYLTHALILDAFVKADPMMPNVLLFIVCVIAVSAVTYRWVEQPAIKLVHRYVKLPRRPVTSSASLAEMARTI